MKYSAALLVLFSLPAFAAPGQIHYVKTQQAQLLAKPSDSAEVALVLAVGRKLVEFDRRGDYVQVGVDKSGGHDGWVKLEQLAATDPDGIAY
ncbi:hypothetical protein [Microbulbifer sp. PSTR4-B]|uniref:hypothetical protein n=1 Tax=unclassified Microbulbifer TaxID=2619833 RepID=UPI00403AC65A